MKARVITDKSLTEAVISSCDVCVVGMVDKENLPYTIPLNFGYHDGVLYLHTGPSGRKVEVLKNNPKVCIVMSTDHKMYHQSEEVACSYGMRYKSVMIKGEVEFITDMDEKINALNIVMKNYSPKTDFQYSEPALKNVNVMRVVPASIECKFFGY